MLAVKPTMFNPCATRVTLVKGSLATVLAQDHFYSEFLGLLLTFLIHTEAMMMIIAPPGV